MEYKYKEIFFDTDMHADTKITPMMRQYKEIKQKYEDSLLLFRMGDFYELFFDDAKTASDVLGLTLTKRSNVPMAGVPYHALDGYLARLIKSGFKIAICDQMEDPKQSKGIVKREVTQVITPGTIVETKYLDAKTNNYFLSFLFSKDETILSVAAVDISTGDIFATEIKVENKKELIEKLIEEIVNFSPKEIMTTEIIKSTDIFLSVKELFQNLYYSVIPNYTAEYTYAYKTLTEHFNTLSLKGIGIEENPCLISLLGSMIYYVNEVSKGAVSHISNIRLYDKKETMTLDAQTRENLEIVNTIRAGDGGKTLFETIDYTVTSMGSRFLKRIIVTPLLDEKKINERLDYVEYFYKDKSLLHKIRDILIEIGDIERLASKLSLLRINPKELVALKKYLLYSLECITLLATKYFEPANTEYVKDIRVVIDIIECAILEEPKIALNEGDIIKDSYDAKLKQYNEARKKGRDWIRDLENEYKSETGINNLKVRYNNVIGYYIEITKSNLSLVPKNFIKRQTLINNERFTTEKLLEYETVINEANEKGYTLEYDIFISVRDKVKENINAILKIASIISLVDVFSSLAHLSYEKKYVRPIVDNGNIIEIKDGRHPVVENSLKASSFIENDVYLDSNMDQLLIITGPNMSGKSTYLRQTAIIALLAQIGSFVPASYAKIGIVDRIFTRVGASDNIARGESTFLVEMNETAYILNHATEKSLIIMDEIGRGTSTYDGLSIAWAIIEYLTFLKNKKSKTLFATHYHELTLLECIDGVKNYNVLVQEYDKEIVFMKKVVLGCAKSSYGIYAATLAGMPETVTNRAAEILKKLERDGTVQVKDIEYNNKDLGVLKREGSVQKTETDYIYSEKKESPVEKELKLVDTNRLTPIEALNLIDKLKKLI